MERTLFSFIWTHSRRDQILLILVTSLLFPLQYLTLELPKRIINDAIGGQGVRVPYTEFFLGQLEALAALCVAFLLAVIAHGLLKMRVNTMKGVLAERLLRRFRYTLIGRILRFPQSYQRRLSEGELTTMVTAESEPLGGLMGDAVAHPLLQAGQMLTILVFLFLQSVWFGLAAIAIIPLQAWLVPRMQAKINVLNRSRIRQVRVLAGEIGDLTSGSATLRQNSGWRYRMARISMRLAGLFETRFEIYQRKFFMKFVNNLLTQLTPFLFFLVGGFLVIQGELTVGALVAALSAYKDIASPWKELLGYYTRMVEMSQRYLLITDRFAPLALLPDFLQERAEEQERLPGHLQFQRVTLQDSDSQTVLNAVDFDAAPGSWTLITAPQPHDRVSFASLLTREIKPLGGKVLIGGQAISDMPQAQLAVNVAHISSDPYVFDGSVGENILMPRFLAPTLELSKQEKAEAQRTGNSDDFAGVEWPLGEDSPQLAEALLRLAVRIGAQKGLLARALERPVASDMPFMDRLIAIRPQAVQAMEGKSVQMFHRDIYIDGLTVAENLFFGIAQDGKWLDDTTTDALNDLLVRLGLRGLVLRQSVVMAEAIVEAFDEDAEASPLFQQIGLPPEMLSTLHRVIKHTGTDIRTPRQIAQDERVLMTLVLNLPAIRFDRTFSVFVKTAIVGARKEARELASAELNATFVKLDWESWHPGLTLLENLAFGKINSTVRARQDEVKTTMTNLLAETLDSETLGVLIRELRTGRKGAALSAEIREVIALGQAVVKKPSIIICDNALASYDPNVRQTAFTALREMMPEATILQLEQEAPDKGGHDRIFELGRGQLLPEGAESLDELQSGEGSDLQRKMQLLRLATLFNDLKPKQLRMLAFSAQWVDIPAGDFVFRKNDEPDGAYLIFEGQARLQDRDEAGEISFEIAPEVGALIGELGLIKKDARRLDMYAETDLVLLRIESEDFLSVIEHDADTAFKLVQVLIGYLDRR